MVRYLFIGMLILSFQWVHPQTCEKKFKHLSVQDGLSRSWVKCIYQDSYGYLWIGTSDGLNRYDGYTFRIYKHHPKNPNSINSNNINVVYEDSKGRLWVGTQVGLNIYNRDYDEFIPLDIIGNYIDCIYEFENGNFLVGSPGGLFFVNTESLSVNQFFNDIYVDDILIDKNHNIWLGTDNGLMLLDTSDYSHITFKHNEADPTSISDNTIRSLYQDSQGNIWIGTNAGGICLMTYEKGNPSQPSFIRYVHDPDNKNSISMGAVLALNEDNSHNLWIGIENGGLNILWLDSFNKSKPCFKHLTPHQTDNASISNNSIHCIYLDNQNTMWIGTYAGGLNYYNRLFQKFRHYTYIPDNPNSLNNNLVNVIYEEGDYLWLGTEKGLNIMNKNTGLFHHFTYDPNDEKSISSNAVWSIFKDSHNNMWIGTWAGGLNLFDPKTKTFKRFLNKSDVGNSLGGYSVCGIIESKEGDLWIASMSGGLYKYNFNSKSYKRFLYDPDRNSISNKWVLTLIEGSNDEIWISTTAAVDLFNKKTEKFVTFSHDVTDSTSISYNGAIVLYKDSNKNIWVGTNGGLDLFYRPDSSFIHYTVDDGLPNNSVNSICEDDHGNLWLSTNNGISKFVNGINDPATPKFINYDASDGLQGNEFNSRSFFKGSDGTIYFGGTNGFNAFHPDSIKDNLYMPIVRFTDFQIFNKPVSIGGNKSPLKKHIDMCDEITLSYKQSVFSIKYAALNFIAPEKNQYAYMLEGFDKDWNYVGTKRIATYTNLDPGRYVFKVKASNNDGLWNENYTSVAIHVLPPWWKTWWAKAFYFLLAIIALYFFRKYTIISVNFKNRLWMDHIEKEKADELNRMKLQFFTNISHELRTPLTLIIGPLNRLLKKASSQELVLIRSNVLRLRNLVDQILDFRKIENNKMQLNTEHVDVIELIRNTVLLFEDLANQKNIQLFFKSGVKELFIDLDADKIEKIINNIISNAIKYTPENGTVIVYVNLQMNDDKRNWELSISISDTGEGIAKENLEQIFDRFYTSNGSTDHTIGTGIGLHLTRRLVELHGGRIEVESELGKGSVFTILVPVYIDFSIDQEEPKVPISERISKKMDQTRAKKNTYTLKHEKTILVVDDNKEMCDYLECILQNEFNVITENNPFRCIELTLDFMPDIIISDVMMPGLSGFELCEKLKIDIRFSHIPVILLTAKATVEDHITGLDTGADEYLYKPFDDNLLKSRINNLIRQREQLRKHFIGSDGLVNKKLSVHSLDKSFMDKIFDMIQENYKDPEFNVNTIVEELSMSRSVFYKKFKALSNLSINDLIKNYRLKRAEELLLNNGLSVSEVAYITGFSEPAYFSKVFKEHYKVSPKDFKNSSKTQAV
jgi:signal transduction histidine kinase/ligand-binding sensor domain-containing protein/DNA-binding response OmpR family regulator